jgi:hypothetical protein
MRLHAPSDHGTVIERSGDMILFRSWDDPEGTWDNWYNLNDLQIEWRFYNKDREYIEAVNKKSLTG